MCGVLKTRSHAIWELLAAVMNFGSMMRFSRVFLMIMATWMLARAALDAFTLITPSLRHALDLNKACMTIARDQDYIHGRDANLAPAGNVYQ